MDSTAATTQTPPRWRRAKDDTVIWLEEGLTVSVSSNTQHCGFYAAACVHVAAGVDGL